MKITILAVLVATASAFSVVPGHLHRSPTTLQAGDLYGELSLMEGPSICWGPEGTLQGHDELAIREYDNFDFFKAAIDQAGLVKTLRSLGPYTLLAPVDSACLAFTGQLDEELLKYHIVLGDVYSDEFTGTFKTLNGNSITCRHEFRRIFVDDALIGQADNHTGGSKYPTDVRCENGIIHAINTVLVPGYAAAGAEDGPVSRRPEEYRVN
eukprot:CAMPEP_0198140736 /NCGR_PEP_ID=MMETSP1443-20131203/3855_1 /TAXON_ID=186043 /ORGANISM="Entomoneis sp., Strain CCMP2396" /LENGTH=209 /DNA_ID=CAMNT_0043803255 /DNA_START=28 /DNA_END=657 /DNA_ORIENTATION=-